MRNKFLIGLTLLFISCSQPKPKEPSEYVNIDFKNLSIQDFIKKVSAITGKKIIVDREIQGKINFVSNGQIQVKELIPLTNAILETKQLTLLNKGSCYTIVKSSGENACICSALSPYHDNITQKMMTKIFQLDNLNSAVIRTKIKLLLSKNAKVSFFKDTNLLSVTDSEHNLKMITMLIEKIKSHLKSN